MQRRKVPMTSNNNSSSSAAVAAAAEDERAISRTTIPFSSSRSDDNHKLSNTIKDHDVNSKKVHHNNNGRSSSSSSWRRGNFIISKRQPVLARIILLFLLLLVLCIIKLNFHIFSSLQQQNEEISSSSSSSSSTHRILHQRIPDLSMPYQNSRTTITTTTTTTNQHQHHPRVLGYYFESSNSDSFTGTERIDPNTIFWDYTTTTLRRRQRQQQQQLVGDKVFTDVTSDAVQRQIHINDDSKEYTYDLAEPLNKGDCVAQYDWQLSSKPNCNALMEVDMTSFAVHTNNNNNNNNDKTDTDNDKTLIKRIDTRNILLDQTVQLIANGYWRDVWKVSSSLPTFSTIDDTSNEGNDDEEEDDDDDDDDDDIVVLKTLRYEHDYSQRNMDRHRRDAIATERLTSSKYALNIYGYCGNSGLFEYADGGSIQDYIWGADDGDDDPDNHPHWSSFERLVVAHQLASGLAALHNSDQEGIPAIAHTDIAPGQFVYVRKDRLFKINDFNRCRFIRKNTKKPGKLCPYHVGNNPGTFRSPEEYAYEPQTEKVDVYSLGNIFYSILTGLWPFYIKHHHSTKETHKKIIAGETPPISNDILNSTDPFDQVMLKAIYQCWTYDPIKRTSARQVQQYIAHELKKLKREPPAQ